jgi:hypothetical protein
MAPESTHLSVFIARAADDIYRYASNPENLPEWAAGLADSPLEQVDGQWVANSPMGRVAVQFAPENSFGILDHDVTLPDGQVSYNPVRVVPAGEGISEVVFSVRRRPGMSDEEWAADKAAVTTDLETLRQVLEKP